MLDQSSPDFNGAQVTRDVILQRFSLEENVPCYITVQRLLSLDIVSLLKTMFLK
jgi:hypothetical protein